jgi:hypothetical protein
LRLVYGIQLPIGCGSRHLGHVAASGLLLNHALLGHKALERKEVSGLSKPTRFGTTLEQQARICQFSGEKRRVALSFWQSGLKRDVRPERKSETRREEREVDLRA